MAAHYYENIDRLKDSVTVTELVNHYGFELNRAGYICCPFHGEKTPSMKIYPDHFKCFGCGAHGDVIKFVEAFQRLDFKEAMNWINREFDLGLPFEEFVPLRQMRAARLARNRIKAARNKRERIREQRNALTCLWAECDRMISEHPVPDTEKIAEAYTTRDYVSFLIDNFNTEEGYPDDII